MNDFRLKTITGDPPNAAVPLSALDGRPLPQDHVYMRNSFSMPVPGAVSGDIELLLPGRPPRIVTPDDLATLPPAGIDMVLECAGNGRSLMTPIPDGLAWDLGGVSPVRVSGVRLVDVLGDLPTEVVQLVMTGADRGTVRPEGDVNYQFSLDVELATSGTALLVTRFGEEPLAHEHGGPVRVVVPGHYAMKSVKWLTRIEGVVEPFSGHFVNRYRYFDDPDFADGSPVGEIQVRSIISRPAEGAHVPAGEVTFAGSAWSGTGHIADAEVSCDDGATWAKARLTPGPAAWSATGWQVEMTLPSGRHRAMVRATDSTGHTQPEQPRWNKRGYANNLIPTIGFEVA
jgi:DMSO/TMAO reductase YedYZ molybdopterin-dependent catalytic subunit